MWSCDFNKEGTKLISCSDDKTLKLWEEQDKSKIMTIFYFFKIKIIFFVKDKNNWKVTATISGYHPRTIYSVKWSNLNTFHHTIRQTCLTCLHISVLCIYYIHNNCNNLVPYNR